MTICFEEKKKRFFLSFRSSTSGFSFEFELFSSVGHQSVQQSEFNEQRRCCWSSSISSTTSKSNTKLQTKSSRFVFVSFRRFSSRKVFVLGPASSASIWDTTIRVYIGCEYECLRGHRFISSSPNHTVRVAQNGVVKVEIELVVVRTRTRFLFLFQDDGTKLVRSDMPLYTPCSCRTLPAGTRGWAQLMRVFVVTPSSSSPIQIVLHPQVVPAGPNNPVFFPSYAQPIHLTEDSIWVLRFPYECFRLVLFFF